MEETCDCVDCKGCRHRIPYSLYVLDEQGRPQQKFCDLGRITREDKKVMEHIETKAW